jgi:HNH endonuclease
VASAAIGPAARAWPAGGVAKTVAGDSGRRPARAAWRCQACGRGGRLDVHHVVKRSQGGSDFDLDQLVALCRWCHDQTDGPYERGRLVVTALGDGQFTFDVIRRPARERTEADVCPRGQSIEPTGSPYATRTTTRWTLPTPPDG